jgi:hypothetical protein
MDAYNEPVVDHRGNAMFHCESCDGPITRLDIEDLGLRLPDSGESADDYLDAELVDVFRHTLCANAARTG